MSRLLAILLTGLMLTGCTSLSVLQNSAANILIDAAAKKKHERTVNDSLTDYEREEELP